MDQAAILLGALRVKARQSGPRLTTAEVESLADAVGIARAALPGLVAALEGAGAVTLVWGGLELRATGAPAARVEIDAGQAPAPAGATMTVRTAFALGALAGLAEELAALAPRLPGTAGATARAAEALLRGRPGPEASAEDRRIWSARLMDTLNELVRQAPESEAVLALAERAHRAVMQG